MIFFRGWRILQGEEFDSSCSCHRCLEGGQECGMDIHAIAVPAAELDPDMRIFLVSWSSDIVLYIGEKGGREFGGDFFYGADVGEVLEEIIANPIDRGLGLMELKSAFFVPDHIDAKYNLTCWPCRVVANFTSSDEVKAFILAHAHEHEDTCDWCLQPPSKHKDGV